MYFNKVSMLEVWRVYPVTDCFRVEASIPKDVTLLPSPGEYHYLGPEDKEEEGQMLADSDSSRAGVNIPQGITSPGMYEFLGPEDEGEAQEQGVAVNKVCVPQAVNPLPDKAGQVLPTYATVKKGYQK